MDCIVFFVLLVLVLFYFLFFELLLRALLLLVFFHQRFSCGIFQTYFLYCLNRREIGLHYSTVGFSGNGSWQKEIEGPQFDTQC